jgi:hypothetical protein
LGLGLGNHPLELVSPISEELIQPVCKLVGGHMRDHIEVAIDSADMTLELKTELGSVRTSEVSEDTWTNVTLTVEYDSEPIQPGRCGLTGRP